MPPMFLFPPPSDSPMSLIHPHTITSISSLQCCSVVHSPTVYARRHAVQKTSEVGANPESRLTVFIHQLWIFPLSSFPLSYSIRWWGGLWESTAPCIHLLNKRVFHNLQCQMRSLKSCLHLPPEKWSLLIFQRQVNRRGRMKYSLCFPYVQFLCNCTTCNFVSYIDSHVFISYGLFARQHIVFDVCIFFKRWLHLCIVGAFVRFSWLDLSVCCHF